jgi:hypothetical protein
MAIAFARVLVRFNHVASIIVNANHSVMRPVAKLRVMRLKSILPLRMRDWQPKRRAWQSTDAIQRKGRSNIPHHCETVGPRNCRLVVDLRSAPNDQSGGSGTVRGFL